MFRVIHVNGLASTNVIFKYNLAAIMMQKLNGVKLGDIVLIDINFIKDRI